MTFNRPMLTRETLWSIGRSCHGPIFVFDDGSDDATLEAINGCGVPIESIFHSKRKETASEGIGGADGNTVRLCREMAKIGRDFFLTSNDFVYTHDSFTVSTLTMREHDDCGMVGLFNGSNHQNRIYSRMGHINEQETVTGPVLVRSDFWSKVEDKIDPRMADWSMAESCLRVGSRILCFNNSIAQHIGIMDGLHMHGPDVGYRFPGEDRRLVWEDGCDILEIIRGHTLIHSDWWTTITYLDGMKARYPVGTDIQGFRV